jgi:thioredoxin reductase
MSNSGSHHAEGLIEVQGMSQYDVVVIGGGAAGLSAALVLSGARRKVVVADAGTPRNAPAHQMHEFLSRGTPPDEFLAAGRHEVKSVGGDIVAGTVISQVPAGSTAFRVLLDNGQRISAWRLLVTTGLRDELPDLAGLQERWARDVLHCPYCHGYEVAGHRLGVLGGAPGAVRYAQIVGQWTDDPSIKR